MTSAAPAPARITQRICEAIKGQIASGQLGPGVRLPSTRALAAEWGVSRTTVTAAYEQLIAEGYVETRQGARTQVAQGLGPAPAPPGRPTPPEPPDRLSAYGRRVAGFDLPPVLDAARVVDGSQQGLDLCARLLLDPGDRVIMEDPGYAVARQVFLAAGAEVVPVAVDRDGMRT